MTKTREAREWHMCFLGQHWNVWSTSSRKCPAQNWLLGPLHRNQSHIAHSNSRKEWRNKETKQLRTQLWDPPLSFNKKGARSRWYKEPRGQGAGPAAAERLANGFHRLETVTDLINGAKFLMRGGGVKNRREWKLWISAILLRNSALNGNKEIGQ